MDKLKEIYKYIIENHTKETPIIDLGCGKGELLRALSKEGYKDLTGVDNKTLPEGNFRFIKADLNRELILDKKYGVVIASFIIEHLKFPCNLIDVAHNLLKEKGTLILSHPNMNNIFHRICFLFTGESMRFIKNNSNNVFITEAILKRILYGSEVYNINNTIEKPKFIIKNRITMFAMLPLLNIKLPNKRIFEDLVMYIMEKNG